MLGKVRAWFGQFKSSSTVHGVAYTVDRGWATALLWYGAVAVGVSLISVYCRDLLVEWNERPLAHPFGRLDTPVTEIQVKICLER